MRFALVSDTYTPQNNGVTTVVRATRQALERAGHSVAAVVPLYPDGAGGQPEELRIPSVAFPPYPDIRLSVPLFHRVNRFLNAFRPDVIHVATEGPLGILGRRYALAHELPLVTNFHADFPRYCRDYGVGALAPLVWRWLSWFHRPAGVTHTPGQAVRDELVARGFSHAEVWGRGVDTGRSTRGSATTAGGGVSELDREPQWFCASGVWRRKRTSRSP